MAPDTLSLAGKTALVTGSSRKNGIGSAIARALARNGASVAIHHVSEQSKTLAEEVAFDINQEFGTKTTVVQGGVENSDSANHMVEQILKAFDVDHIDILVHNQAAAAPNPVLEATAEQLENEFRVNVFGVIYLTQAVVGVGQMPKGGRIINIGSASSKLLVPSLVYTVTKAAQDALTTLLAGELGTSHGITVNTIAPGPIPTDMSKAYLVEPDGSPTAFHTSLAAQTRGGDRLGTIEDIADATLLLVSEKSRWITAQWISVSGGLTGTM